MSELSTSYPHLKNRSSNVATFEAVESYPHLPLLMIHHLTIGYIIIELSTFLASYPQSYPHSTYLNLMSHINIPNEVIHISTAPTTTTFFYIYNSFRTNYNQRQL